MTKMTNQEAKEIVQTFREAMDHPETQYKDILLGALDMAIEALGRESNTSDGWIPVSKRLPDNSENEGQLCKRVSVMTRYGVTEGWYNPDFKTWFVLVWYMGRSIDERVIDFERADYPAIVDDVDVIAWKPLPEPYKKEGE